MSDVRGEVPESFAQKAAVCVPRHVSHSVGASIFFLGYAMSQAGIFNFTIVLLIEAYFSGCSKLYLQEMVKCRENQQANAGIEYNNYFLVVEKHLSSKLRHFVRIIFIVDVIFCTAFYYKIVEASIEALVFHDHASSRSKTGTKILTYSATTLFLIGMEYSQKYMKRRGNDNKTPTKTVNNVMSDNIAYLYIDNRPGNSDGEKEEQSNQEERGIDMEAVSREMNNFDRKRPLLLLLFMLLFFCTIVVSHNVANSKELKQSPNVTEQCPGLLEPISFFNIDVNIMNVAALLLYAFKTYAMMLPICHEELHYELKDFTGIVTISESVLAFIYLVFPLSVYLTFGGSSPILFFTGYGKNIVGIPIAAIALAITGNAMLLRVLACFKLIQVLFCKIDTENVFWLIVISLSFASLLVASVTTDVTYLVILSGSVTSNLLTNIIPAFAYIKFKWRDEHIGDNIVQAFHNLLWHMCLLFGAFTALYSHDPTVGKGCRNIMNRFWAANAE